MFDRPFRPVVAALALTVPAIFGGCSAPRQSIGTATAFDRSRPVILSFEHAPTGPEAVYSPPYNDLPNRLASEGSKMQPQDGDIQRVVVSPSPIFHKEASDIARSGQAEIVFIPRQPESESVKPKTGSSPALGGPLSTADSSSSGSSVKMSTPQN